VSKWNKDFNYLQTWNLSLLDQTMNTSIFCLMAEQLQFTWTLTDMNSIHQHTQSTHTEILHWQLTEKYLAWKSTVRKKGSFTLSFTRKERLIQVSSLISLLLATICCIQQQECDMRCIKWFVSSVILIFSWSCNVCLLSVCILLA
jgi:hypothetical protein